MKKDAIINSNIFQESLIRESNINENPEENNLDKFANMTFECEKTSSSISMHLAQEDIPQNIVSCKCLNNLP